RRPLDAGRRRRAARLQPLQLRAAQVRPLASDRRRRQRLAGLAGRGLRPAVASLMSRASEAPHFEPGGLRATKWWEYAVRFGFGGLVTMGTGLIAQIAGAVTAGLFLGFPSILPASLVLLQRHDGREAAVEE